MATPDRWMMMDASSQGELRLAFAAAPSGRPNAADIRRYDARELPTFTDALLRFEREVGGVLLGTEAVLAVAGAVAGNTITIARSRWVISRSGLGALFGRPVRVFNDVAVQAWATLDGVTVRRQMNGTGAPAHGAPGRTVLLTVDDGVGAAVVQVDRSGQTTVIETEFGHTEFPVTGAADEALCRTLVTGGGEQPSWEQVLMAALTGDGRSGDDAARLAGRFAGNAVLAFGAWNGVMITGRNAMKLAYPAARTPFAEGYLVRRGFRRQLEATPCWIIEQQDPVMAGLAKLLRQGEPVAV